MMDRLYYEVIVSVTSREVMEHTVIVPQNLIAASALGSRPGSPALASGEDHAGDGTLAIAHGGVVSAMPSSWASVLVALAGRPGAGPGTGPGTGLGPGPGAGLGPTTATFS
jgi:hypothetical protein